MSGERGGCSANMKNHSLVRLEIERDKTTLQIERKKKMRFRMDLIKK